MEDRSAGSCSFSTGQIKFSAQVRSKTWKENAFQEGLKMVRQIFDKINEVYADQQTLLRKIPTVYGKFLVFQAIPIIADYLRDETLLTSIILIISPLKALMQDQVSYLQSLALNFVAVTEDADDELIDLIKKFCSPNFLYISPESILSIKKWRDILQCENFKKHCIGVVFDKAHCISHY